jgi:hypothetical protein
MCKKIKHCSKCNGQNKCWNLLEILETGINTLNPSGTTLRSDTKATIPKQGCCIKFCKANKIIYVLKCKIKS